MTVLDAKTVLETLAEVVAENNAEGKTYADLTPRETSRDPLYTKDSMAEEVPLCYYSNRDGSPSCLVGRVIAKLNPDAFAKIAVYEESTGFSFKIADLPDSIALELSADAMGLLWAAQFTQDSGGAWGEALADAQGVYDAIEGEV